MGEKLNNLLAIEISLVQSHYHTMKAVQWVRRKVKVEMICWKGKFWAWSERVTDDDKDGLTSGIETGMIRLTKWIWEFIPKTRWWISKWTICDFQCATVDEQLFNNICHNENHVLYSLLPPPSTASQNYHLRPRADSQQLPQHTGHLTDSNFITRMLFTDIY